jgi:adenylate cyclase
MDLTGALRYPSWGRLAMERRLAAILDADVVGYSRLMEIDEAGTLAALKAHQDQLINIAIAEHHGHIVKLMGDGVLAEFASVVDAVSCAVAIQTAMAERNRGVPDDQRIDLRVGVHLGDILVEDSDIFGDGVNVAARLEGLAEPGGICLSQQAYDQIETKLDLKVEDLGRQQVKNIARPVHAYRVLISGKASRWSKALPRPLRPRRRFFGSAIAVGILLTVGVSGWWWASDLHLDIGLHRVQPAFEMPSIVVLPFQNLSEDQKNDYFVDGITEDLITDLSKVGGLFVISRSTAFSYKGRSVSISELAGELGVRYVLEGSIRRAGDRIRVNAQLIDAKTDRHLWAERYDRQLTDVFAVQDDVKREIVDALEVKLSAGERSELTRKPPSSLEAYEYYLRARQAMLEGEQRSLQLAYWAFEKAIELDPAFAEAYAGLAMASAVDYSGGSAWSDWARPPSTTHATVERMSQRALALKPGLALAELAMVRLRLAEFRFDDALRHVERAVALEPGSSEVLNFHARVLTALGRHAEAKPIIEEAFRRNPKAPADQYETLGMIQFALGEYAAAKTSLMRAFGLMTVSPNWITAAFLAAAYGFTGEPLSATIARYTPSLNDVTLFPFYEHPADQKHLLDGIRRANAPEFPLGFTPSNDAGRRLQNNELKATLYGRRFSTWCPGLQLNGAMVFDPSGMMTWQLRHDFSDTGPSQPRNDRLCATFSVLTRGREACFSIFEIDADKSPGGDYSFVLAGPELCYLSPTE